MLLAINALRRYPTRIKTESEVKALPNVGQKTVVKIMVLSEFLSIRLAKVLTFHCARRKSSTLGK